MIALDVAEQISAAGAHAVIANSPEQALSAFTRKKFAVAIIDHLLGHDDAGEVIWRLEKLQVPFVIYSGCGDDSAWANAPVVRKPATREHLIQTVTDLLG